MVEENNHHTTGDLIEHAINIERQAFSVYCRFSRLFSHIHEISSFWNDMSEDEKCHEEMLKDIYNCLSRQERLLPARENVWRKVLESERLLDRALKVHVKNLEEAYELSHELESYEVDAVFAFLAEKFVPFEKKQRSFVPTLGITRIKLINFGKKFGNADRREQITSHDI